MKIRKDDIIMVRTGEDAGKKGRVLKVFPKKQRIIVEGVNLIKKHMRPSQQYPQGGIIEKEAPIHVSNVMLVVQDKPTRIGYNYLKDGTKVRIAKKTGEIIQEKK